MGARDIGRPFLCLAHRIRQRRRPDNLEALEDHRHFIAHLKALAPRLVAEVGTKPGPPRVRAPGPCERLRD